MVGLGFKEKEKAAPIVPGFKIKGDTIAGRYRVEKLLGAGSSGFVVAARHVYLRRRVTLKILASTTTAHQRAQRRHLAAAHEAAALRGLHVARIVDTGFTEDGMPFIATERLEGRTLGEELAERTSLPPAEAVRWIMQAGVGLAEAHAAGLVHGDLKPQNLFLAGDASAAAAEQGGESRVLKILDFGMATPAEDREDEGTSAWFASPAYLAPEQIRDPASVDARADIWALGVILHELIAGHLPFSADTVSGMLVAVAYDEPALLVAEGVPFELARVVRACLAKEPSGRPVDVAALAKALAPFAGGEGVGLARRVDAALSSRPPMAMTIDRRAQADGDGAVVDAAGAERAASAEGDASGASTALASGVARARGTERRRVDRAIQRRRLGAIAVVGAAAVLAIAGLLAPSAQPEADDVRREAVDVPPPPAPSAGPLTFVPAAPPEREPEALATPPAAAPAPKPLPLPPARWSSPPAASRAPARAPTANGPRASLAVRENPYTQGFTHPKRLSERRK
ncbi:MAG: serine/threonine protein kinase [Labilithrix sp.]|nr:serine/threonine protein kinase [Labilithrix sp.]